MRVNFERTRAVLKISRSVLLKRAEFLLVFSQFPSCLFLFLSENGLKTSMFFFCLKDEKKREKKRAQPGKSRIIVGISKLSKTGSAYRCVKRYSCVNGRDMWKKEEHRVSGREKQEEKNVNIMSRHSRGLDFFS